MYPLRVYTVDKWILAIHSVGFDETELEMSLK